MILIITNQANAHIDEAEAFKSAFDKLGAQSEIMIVGRKYKEGVFMWEKLFNIFNFIESFDIYRKIVNSNFEKVLITAPVPKLLVSLTILKILRKKVEVFYLLHEPKLLQKNIYSFFVNSYHALFIKKVDHLLFLSSEARNTFFKFYKNYKGDISNIILFRKRDLIECPKYSVREKRHIGFIGNFSVNKNIHLFLDVAKELPFFDFLLAGNGDIEQFRSDISKMDNIKVINRFLGADEYFSLIDECLFILLPYGQSTQSGVVLDALCRGTIPIATDVGSFATVINSGQTGYVYMLNSFVENVVSLASNLDYSKLEKMSLDGLKHYNANYSFETFLNSVSAIFNYEII